MFEGEEYTRENLRQTDEMIASHEPEPGYDFALAELLWQRISMMEKLGASRGEIEQFEEKHRDQPGHARADCQPPLGGRALFRGRDAAY